MYHFLYCVNESFAQHCAVSMYSLAVNNRDKPSQIVIAGIGLSSSTKAALLETLAGFPSYHVEIVDFDETQLRPFPQIGYYSKDIYLRLWVDEYFPPEIDKALYLDADTLVVDDIADLFSTDISQHLFGAVDIPGATSHSRCHLPEDQHYFNSGVLLFNIFQWRAQHGRQQTLAFLLQNREIALNPDQDALNGCFYQSRLALDYKYNLISPFFRKRTLSYIKEEKQKAVEDAVVVHFNGRSRPWLYSCNHPYQRKYLEYLEQTPWSEQRPLARSILDQLKKHIRIVSGIESFVRLTNVKGI